MTSKNNTIKYFVYCRKSSEDEDRQILSIDSQIEALKELSQKFGLKIVETFTESKSAKAPGREVFSEMIKRIENNEAQGILCWKLDRLARNPVDEGKIKWLLQSEVLKHIKTPEKDYYPDDNVLITSVEFGVANQYIKDLSKNVKRGLKTKLQMGWYPSYAPLGYLNTKFKEKGENKIFKDPERFEIVKQMWQLMLTGNYTPPQILKIVNKEWNFKTRTTKKYISKSLSRSGIYQIFTNPFYYGWFDYPRGSGNWYKGEHESMISEEEYDRVQAILGRKGKPRPKKHIFAFTGLMRCGSCGAGITAEEKFKKQKNGNLHHYIYYHCTKRINPDCTEKAIELKELNKQIDGFLEKISISERFRDWALKYLHEIRQDEAKATEDIVATKHKAYENIVKQLDNLLIKYTSPENADERIMTEQEYTGLRTRLLKEKTELEAELNATGKQIEEWVELTEKTFNFARYARIWFAKGDLQTKRAIFACLGSDLVLKDKKLALTLRKPFNFIFEGLSQVERELVRLEPLNFGSNKEQTAILAAKCPTLLRGQGSNLDLRVQSPTRLPITPPRKYFEVFHLLPEF